MGPTEKKEEIRRRSRERERERRWNTYKKEREVRGRHGRIVKSGRGNRIYNLDEVEKVPSGRAYPYSAAKDIKVVNVQLNSIEVTDRTN